MGWLSAASPGLSASLGRHLDAADHHRSVDCLEHVEQGEAGHANSGERFHFDAGDPVRSHLRIDSKSGERLVELDPDLGFGQRQWVAERDELGGALGGHHPGELGGRDHRALRIGTGATCSRVSARQVSVPDAVAVRAVGALSDTSTMRARPLSSRCVSLVMRKDASGADLPGKGAGPVSAVQLEPEHQVPAVPAGAGRAGKTEDERVLDLPGESA
jgi:hypothetical protein